MSENEKYFVTLSLLEKCKTPFLGKSAQFRGLLFLKYSDNMFYTKEICYLRLCLWKSCNFY